MPINNFMSVLCKKKSEEFKIFFKINIFIRLHVSVSTLVPVLLNGLMLGFSGFELKVFEWRAFTQYHYL